MALYMVSVKRPNLHILMARRSNRAEKQADLNKAKKFFEATLTIEMENIKICKKGKSDVQFLLLVPVKKHVIKQKGIKCVLVCILIVVIIRS